MKTDFYFTTFLTETEHSIVEYMIREECQKREIEVSYYRKFKTGHVACYRECKILTAPKIGQEILKSLDISWGNYFAEIKNPNNKSNENHV